MYYAISGDDGFLIIKNDTKKVIIDEKQKGCSFLCFANSNENCEENCDEKSFLFAVTEAEKTSALSLYQLDYIAKTAKKIDTVSINGGSLCHLSYSAKHSVLFGSCYGDGILFSMPFSSLNPVLGEITYHRQIPPLTSQLTRTHCGVLSKSEDILFSANIALDRIYSYALANGSITEIGFLQLPKGIGPRHILPINESSYYVITEYSNEILLVKDNALSGRFTTLSDDFIGESFGASLAFDEERKLLYASNRGENSIAVFDVQEDFTLSNIRHFPCGNWPRHISLCENNTFLAVAASKSDRVDFYEVLGNLENNKSIFSFPLKSASFVKEI